MSNEMCKVVSETKDNTGERKLGFDINNFIKESQKSVAEKVKMKSSESKENIVHPGFSNPMQLQQLYRYVNQIQVPDHQFKMLAQTLISEVHNQLDSQQTSIHLPELLIQHDGAICKIKPKSGNGVAYDMEPIASFCFVSVQKINYIGYDNTDIKEVCYQMKIKRTNGREYFFELTQEQLDSQKLFSVLQDIICEPIHMRGNRTEINIALRNLIYTQAKLNSEYSQPYYPGFYVEDGKYKYAYGESEDSKIVKYDSNLVYTQNINAEGVFRDVEQYFSCIENTTCRQMLYITLHEGVIASFLAKHFRGISPQKIIQCKTLGDVEFVNAYVGAIYPVTDSGDKSFKKLMEKRKDGTTLVCFDRRTSSYLHKKMKELLEHAARGEEEEWFYNNNVLAVNVNCREQFDEDLSIICDYCRTENTVNVESVISATRQYLQIFIGWVIENVDQVKKLIADSPYEDFTDKYKCIVKIITCFLGNYRINCLLDDYEMALEELRDIDVMGGFEENLKELREKFLQELLERHIAFITEKRKRKFVVDKVADYEANIYVNGDALYINTKYFDSVVKECVSTRSNCREFLKELSENGILENLESAKGCKISVMTEDGEELPRLNVWKCKKELFNNEVLMMGGLDNGSY